MARIAKDLTALEVGRLTTPGTHACGRGLYLEVKESGARSWILRIMVGVRRRHIGLGSFPTTPLKEAREKALQARELIASGVDPIEHKKAARSALLASQAKEITFKECALAYLDTYSDQWRISTYKEWERTLRLYAYPVLGDMLVRDVDQSGVLAVIKPIWKSKTDTAARVRLRIELVLDWAAVRGYRSHENPARWRGQLNKLLPNPGKVSQVKHLEALPHEEMPAYMAALRQKDVVPAKCLEFLILTAARSFEARAARWEEMDLENRVWTIPAERMKTHKSHQVPLSDEAMAILKDLRQVVGEKYIFFSFREGQCVAKNSVLRAAQKIRPDITAHGFRSTFRDWIFDCTDYSRELAEMALSHVVGSAVENAYRRSTGVEKRRPLMQAWADFCYGRNVNE